jgi:ABC-type branched-subunit amino acid transport system substrate-binding protein
MGKKFIIGLFIVTAFSFAFTANAQTDSSKKTPTYRVGIFAPLYLDSVFSNGSFRYKEGFPKFIVPAVEFVQGAEIALDSMKVGNENVEAFIYDTRSYTKNIAYLIKNKQLDNLDLIIGSVKDADYRYLADFALAKKIPFISATHPNDGGLTGNPYTVIMNSTLKAHCEAIYSYLLQTHGTDNIYFCRKKGTQEDKIAMYFKILNEQDGKSLLNIQTINLDSSITSDFFRTKLDSNRQSVILGASLDESFATKLALACNDLHETYPMTLIGMPNWDGFASLQKKDDFKDLPIHFTSPYYNSKWDSYSKMLTAAYSKKFKNKPTDMAYKGFEMAYMFTKLLIKYPRDFMGHINDKSVKVFCDYNIKPVLLKKENTTPDYFENKHLYFVKLLNGVKSKAW